MLFQLCVVSLFCMCLLPRVYVCVCVRGLADRGRRRYACVVGREDRSLHSARSPSQLLSNTHPAYIRFLLSSSVVVVCIRVVSVHRPRWFLPRGFSITVTPHHPTRPPFRRRPCHLSTSAASLFLFFFFSVLIGLCCLCLVISPVVNDTYTFMCIVERKDKPPRDRVSGDGRAQQEQRFGRIWVFMRRHDDDDDHHH